MATYYQTTAWGVQGEGQPFQRMGIRRRDSGVEDVEIDVWFCGVGHLDMHFVLNNFYNTRYPLIPGCEVAGVVSRVGERVPDRFKEGDNVGVGLVVGSCRTCPNCLKGEEQACDKDFTQIFNSDVRHGQNLFTDQGYTYGGMSCRITIHHRYVVKVPGAFPLNSVPPMMTTGLSLYAALKHWNAHKGGLFVGVIGLGAAGICAIAMATKMGNEVTAISQSDERKKMALEAGALELIVSDPNHPFERTRGRRLHIILNTMSQPHDVSIYLPLLRYGGKIIQLGLIMEPVQVIQFPDLLRDRLGIAGSFLGGMCDAQETLNFAAQHQIRIPVEIITVDKLDEVVNTLSTEYGLIFRNVVDIKQSFKILLANNIPNIPAPDEDPRSRENAMGQGNFGAARAVNPAIGPGSKTPGSKTPTSSNRTPGQTSTTIRTVKNQSYERLDQPDGLPRNAQDRVDLEKKKTDISPNEPQAGSFLSNFEKQDSEEEDHA